MLTRLGSAPGPAWMRNFSEPSGETPGQRRILPVWLFFLLYMMVILALTHLATAIVFSGQPAHVSPTQIAGLPLLSYGGTAKGVIAIGGKATGVMAIGGRALGWRAIGGLAIGEYVYAGKGVAYGSSEARGRQKEHLIG